MCRSRLSRGWDLRIDVLGSPFPIFARVALSADGTQLTITTNLPEVPPITIPFGATRTNLVCAARAREASREMRSSTRGGACRPREYEHSGWLAIGEEPLPDGELVPRGDPGVAQSFLLAGQHIAFGMARATFARFANNIWHTNLRADDGTHPLPDAENKRGDWAKVTMHPEAGKIRLKLEGDIPVDSPLIDVVPDPHVADRTAAHTEAHGREAQLRHRNRNRRR